MTDHEPLVVRTPLWSQSPYKYIIAIVGACIVTRIILDLLLFFFGAVNAPQWVDRIFLNFVMPIMVIVFTVCILAFIKKQSENAQVK